MSSSVFLRRSRGLALVAAASASLAFAVASAHADVKICQALEQRYEQIERGATTLEVNAMLFSAADKGCEPLAKTLLDAGASLEARDGRGFNPLARAAKSGQKEIVALFLDRGAQIDARSLEGATALYEAAETGRLPIVRELVDRGANISLAGRSGITPLAAAAYMGSEPIVELLIEKGADPKIDGQDREDRDRLCRRPRLPRHRHPPARSWRRHQCALWQRSDRADVGGGIFRRSRHARHGEGDQATARSRRAPRRSGQSRPDAADDRRRAQSYGRGRSAAGARRRQKPCATSRARAQPI